MTVSENRCRGGRRHDLRPGMNSWAGPTSFSNPCGDSAEN